MYQSNYWLLLPDSNRGIPLTIEQQSLGFRLWLAYAVFLEKMKIIGEEWMALAEGWNNETKH